MKARFWSMALACKSCDWEIEPETKVALKDVLFPQKKCPHCQGAIYLKHMSCPKCQAPYKRIDASRSMTEMFKGISVCNHCGCKANRWGEIAK